MVSRFKTLFVVVLSVLLAMPLAAADIARVTGGGSVITWHSNGNFESLSLKVVAPDGTSFETSSNGSSISFNLRDISNAGDGSYNYYLSGEPRVNGQVRKALNEARARGDEAEVKRIQKENGLTVQAMSGWISVRNGAIHNPADDTAEPDANDTSVRGGGVAGEATSTTETARNGRPNRISAEDQVIPDDLIVQSSTCTGFDCVDGESFGFDTLRLKENNLRINFDDTSTSAGYPANDWRIIANDSGSGGASYLSIEDSTAARNLVLIEAAAPANSLYVDSTGRIGYRQSAPLLDHHTTTADTPAIRLEQTNAGGFTAQTWDIGANEANFFVRDLTGGSRLSLRIRPGAATSSLDIAANSNVGFSVASPAERLHAYSNSTTDTSVGLRLDMDVTNGRSYSLQSTGTASTLGAGSFGLFDVDANAYRVVVNSSGFLGIGSAAPVAALSVANDGTNLAGTAYYASRIGNAAASKGTLLGYDTSKNGGVMSSVGASSGLYFWTHNGTSFGERVAIAPSGAVTINGNLQINGTMTATSTKSFAHVDPNDSSKAFYYVALEGPEAGTYFRGSAKTADGKVEIELPTYFSRITEEEDITVQLTPVGAWGNLYVVSKSANKIVVAVPEGMQDLKFDYFVQGIRKGYKDFQVERPFSETAQ